MKYLKNFENKEENINNKELVHKFKDKILLLLNKFFKDNNYKAPIHCEDYLKSGNYYNNFKYIMMFSFKENGDMSDPFLEIDISFNVYKFEVLFYLNYIGTDTYIISEKFKEYFCSIIKPLSFNYDADVEFNLRKDNFEKSISKLSIDSYILNNDTKKYNL